MIAAPRAVARIEHSEALLNALRNRVEELKLTHEVIDQLSGFSGGYASKLLANPPIRRMGHFSLFLLLQTLGLDMVLMENPQALPALAKETRRKPIMLRRLRTVVFTADSLRLNGSKGGIARAANQSPAQRSALARRASRARWAKNHA